MTTKEVKKSVEEFRPVIKVDRTHGVVLGWGIVCTEKGADYYDLQDEHIPEDVMFNACVDFNENCQMASEMHVGDDRGAMFTFPMTSDVAKAFGFPTDVTGMMVMLKPAEACREDVLTKFETGVYKGFSIGGSGTVLIEEE